MRTNYRAENERLVATLNRLLDRPTQSWITTHDGQWVAQVGHFYIARAYGEPRLHMVVSEGGGQRDISPRLSNKELNFWLHGMIQGVESGKNFICSQF